MWCGLDERTNAQVRWSGDTDGLFIADPIIDIAAREGVSMGALELVI